MTCKFSSGEMKDFQDLAGYIYIVTANHNKYFLRHKLCSRCSTVTAHLCMFMSAGITSISYLGKGNEGRWWRGRRRWEKKEREDLKVKLHADVLYFLFVFVCDGLAAAANAGFQFSKHLGLHCLLNVCRKREAERDALHNYAGLKVKDKNTVERKVKIEEKEKRLHAYVIWSTEESEKICKNVPHTDFPDRPQGSQIIYVTCGLFFFVFFQR